MIFGILLGGIVGGLWASFIVEPAVTTVFLVASAIVSAVMLCGLGTSLLLSAFHVPSSSILLFSNMRKTGHWGALFSELMWLCAAYWLSLISAMIGLFAPSSAVLYVAVVSALIATLSLIIHASHWCMVIRNAYPPSGDGGYID